MQKSTSNELNTQDTSLHFLDQDEILMVHRTLARAIGLNAAIVLRQVHYWVGINAKTQSKGNYHDGCYWTFNSIRKWTENDFSFWSEDTVERAFSELIALRLIYTAEYNKRSGDRTKWYTVNYGAYSAFMRLWTDHNYPPYRAHRQTEKAARAAFIEDWAVRSEQYATLDSCQRTAPSPQVTPPHYRNLPPPLPQLAPSVTIDYPKTTKEKNNTSSGDDGGETPKTVKPVVKETDASPVSTTKKPRPRNAMHDAFRTAYRLGADDHWLPGKLEQFLSGAMPEKDNAGRSNAAWLGIITEPRELTPELVRGFGEYWRANFKDAARPRKPETIATHWFSYLSHTDFKRYLADGAAAEQRAIEEYERKVNGTPLPPPIDIGLGNPPVESADDETIPMPPEAKAAWEAAKASLSKRRMVTK